jgi:prefoldin subunit 1
LSRARARSAVAAADADALTRPPRPEKNPKTKHRKQVRQSQQRAATQLRRAELTLEELTPLPESAQVFRPLGRAYVGAGRAELVAELEAACAEGRAEASKLGVQAERAEAQLKATEEELRELVRSAPEAAAALMRMGGGGGGGGPAA